MQSGFVAWVQTLHQHGMLPVRTVDSLTHTKLQPIVSPCIVHDYECP